MSENIKECGKCQTMLEIRMVKEWEWCNHMWKCNGCRGYSLVEHVTVLNVKLRYVCAQNVINIIHLRL
jgi:hypothetical protein